jgi:hypothetical protein
LVEDPLEEGNLGADRGEELGVEGAQRIDDALHFLLGDQHKFGVLLTHDTPHAKRGEREREINNSPLRHAACCCYDRGEVHLHGKDENSASGRFGLLRISERGADNDVRLGVVFQAESRRKKGNCD